MKYTPETVTIGDLTITRTENGTVVFVLQPTTRCLTLVDRQAHPLFSLLRETSRRLRGDSGEIQTP
jgi:hypothetical protein